MKLLTVIKNGKFTGTQYEQDSDAIRAHHASQGETLYYPGSVKGKALAILDTSRAVGGSNG